MSRPVTLYRLRVHDENGCPFIVRINVQCLAVDRLGRLLELAGMPGHGRGLRAARAVRSCAVIACVGATRAHRLCSCLLDGAWSVPDRESWHCTDDRHHHLATGSRRSHRHDR